MQAVNVCRNILKRKKCYNNQMQINIRRMCLFYKMNTVVKFICFNYLIIYFY